MLRTAKSCGPDAPTLASSLRRHVGPTGLRQPISANDGGKQARSPGRARRKPLKPLRAGMPGDPGGPVVNTRVLPAHCTRGCGCNGHPAFPTPSLGRKINAQLGRIAPRGAKLYRRTMLLFGVCAKCSLTSPRVTHSSCPDLIRASINLRNKFFQRGWVTGSSPVMTISIGMTALARAEPSQLPRIAERERRHPPCVLVEDQGAGDRRFGALAAIFAFAKPAVDADRRALGFLEIHARRIDQLCGVADFAAEPDRKARLRLRVRRHRPAHHLRDREIPVTVGQFDHLFE